MPRNELHPAPGERRVKVAALTRPAPAGLRPTCKNETEVPLLRLSGIWMQEAGFHVGAQVCIKVEANRLVLTPAEQD